MVALLSTVFIASVCGSLHCVGMCGPLAVLASSRTASSRSVSSGADSRRPLWSNIAAYHGSRVIAYGVSGLIAGIVGSGIQHTGTLLGAQRLAAQLAGGTMLVIGLLAIVRLLSGNPHSVWLPKFIERRLHAGHTWARKQRPLVRAGAVGFLTAILPCGWLFAFLIVAAGTANPLWGAAVMSVFALGSIPALGLVVIGADWISGRFRRVVPWASAILVTFIGMVTLASRSQADLSSLQSLASREISTRTELVQQVQNISETELPCCAVTGERECKCGKKMP